MREWACVNGTLSPAEEAHVSVFDSGFMQGIGLFETMRAYHGHVFRLDQHIERLRASAGKLGWTVLPDREACRDNVSQVVHATGGEDARVRLTVTTGSLRAAAAETPELTTVATASQGARYPDECYTRGVTALVSECRQDVTDPTVGHKTLSYFARLAALRQAHARSAFEAIWFTPENYVAEACISNIFVVRDEQLLTPPLDTPVLPGITRATVMDLAVAEDIPTREARLTIHDLLGADEVFLTNSLMEIVPVVRVERQPIDTEKPGEVTRQLAIAYGKLIDKESGNA